MIASELCTVIKFHDSKKWYTNRLESVLEKQKHMILSGFDTKQITNLHHEAQTQSWSVRKKELLN